MLLREKTGIRKPFVWSFVGAGGKTTGIFCIAEYLQRKGFRVLVTTTTHMAKPDGNNFVSGECVDDIRRKLDERGFCVAGISVTERKIKGISMETVDEVLNFADAVLIEADGSARLPFKIPASYEPVIYPKTDRILVTEGLSALARPVSEICHRKELFCELTGLSSQDLLDEEKMAEGIVKGYLCRMREEFPDISLAVILNQADDKTREAAGEKVAENVISLWNRHKNVPQVLVYPLSWRRIRENKEDLDWLFI
ncbi:putative selenium-dependent hydroxylase accessory protein YqeC [Blautia liquoris]|uniref:Putative selenium-dependent hydroxylase accessory protein YqeC n=1 Tax=Blautia liquoris TaxID=2779518 RepID=A0A7M2RD81_9FIRM|nr:selenium cofactor biosynthesis protein YqeC [Blautia liquoris]QOV18273.1 putative selenium-dependent hydroxylase accessory protein YqeC [Blautia liquoris]